AGCGADSEWPGEPADHDVDISLGSGEVAPASGATAKLIIPGKAAQLVPDRYIVQLKDAVVPMGGPPVGGARRAAKARDIVLRHGLSEQAVVHVYEVVLNGFVVSMSAATARRLAEDPDVELVQQGQVMSVNTDPLPFGLWGLDRIDQRGHI